MRHLILSIGLIGLLGSTFSIAKADNQTEGFVYERLEFIEVEAPYKMKEVDHMMKFNRRNRIKRKKRTWWTNGQTSSIW